MMFRPGDRVTVAEHFRKLVPGKIYTVNDSYLDGVRLVDHLYMGYYTKDIFKLYIVDVVNKNIEKVLT